MPIEQESDPNAKIFEALWKDCEEMQMDDERKEVMLSSADGCSKVILNSEVDYRRFKLIFGQYVPKQAPFIDFGNSFIARKGTYRRRLTRML